MKNLKRLFGILLILVTMLCLLSVTASAATPESDFQYKTNAAYAFITKFVGKGQDIDVVIPETLGGKQVAYIREGAFKGNYNIRSVQLPTGLVKIEKNAFSDCWRLKLVVIQGRRLGKVEENAFSGVEAELLILPRAYDESRLTREGTNVTFRGGKFQEVVEVVNHNCQDKYPTDHRCDICGKTMNSLNSFFCPAAALGRMAEKTAEVVGRTVVKNTAKALVTTAVVIRSILKLF